MKPFVLSVEASRSLAGQARQLGLMGGALLFSSVPLGPAGLCGRTQGARAEGRSQLSAVPSACYCCRLALPLTGIQSSPEAWDILMVTGIR